ncbi:MULTISPECIES: PP2C family protein-serine/threonine phosphatase [unclassified Treponema]|uniref:PP2C family protein-serine/threonine phosphatase n=1 Tax=unclassified Treponema TaxID=2638727 RepID=UPI0020A4001B|nr:MULTISPECIES: SpoIIE family protein phosphatase [unclassified Treponema]UTC66510.1 SpoIIE family protein phosphatase [Treponema sp. OMZ 789]UTC69242.1 SpoIIE family protein phosphatase [Treponema sp. OMZ 790]UTC71955.1 SpoIIE family protein phosphatase [Treponema sp. OMZ 791]
MIKLRKLLSNILISIGMGSVFALFSIFVSPRFLFLGKFYSANDMTLALSRLARIPEIRQEHRFAIGALVFIIVAIFTDYLLRTFYKKIENTEYARPKNKIFVSFLERLRFCYTIENLIDAVQTELEYAGDCSVMLVDAGNNIVLYNSSSRFISSPETFTSLNEITAEYKPGVYYFNADMQKCTLKKARIAAVLLDDIHFFIICGYFNEIEPEIFNTMFSEFLSYQNRISTLEQLLYFSELSQEWNMVANTQKAFLPQKLPEMPMLELAAYFKPLVNVSGDYYDAIKIDDNKTLLVVGDVSGKGLSAALVMGIVVNTIKIAKNKEDLPALILAVDSAIKRMGLLDKYTVLFLGLVDTEKMTIKYVNASMEDPMILTESPDGYKVKVLESTCSIVGIIEFDKIEVHERPLYRGDVILMMTDGVPESMNNEGVELAETDNYMESIKSFVKDSAEDIVEKVAGMAYAHTGNQPMRDDITIMCAKVKG